MPWTDPRPIVTDLAASVTETARRLSGGRRLALAVSGGGDSMFLLHALAPDACAVVSVHHGLRAEAEDELEMVARACTRLGLPHTILHWDGPAHRGNLQAGAREARRGLIAQWSKTAGVDVVALGHNRDDVAESLIMRLSRAAGIEGLAAMSEHFSAHGAAFIRPMLRIGRAEARSWLSARDIRWADDPSNDDPSFTRVRARQAIAELGMDTAALAQSAFALSEARDALRADAMPVMKAARCSLGRVDLPAAAMAGLPVAVRRMTLTAAIRWVTGETYPPRAPAMAQALDGLARGCRTTVGGTLISPKAHVWRVTREAAASARAAHVAGGVWDARWQVPPLSDGQHWAALGSLNARGAARARLGMGHDEAAASPAIWSRSDLIATPLFDGPAALRPSPLRHHEDLLSTLWGE